MGLLNKDSKAPAQEAPEQEAGDQNFFDGMEGAGLEGLTQDTVSTAYLGMVQPGSSAAVEHEPGTWRNSASNENYGKSIEVVALAFKTVWTERSKDPPYNTVGRYEPNSIQVHTEYPKPGTRGFPKMTNPNTGNKVEELFIYACMRPDHPEDGVMYFSPTVGSMKTCKQWNAMLRSQRLPSGKLAPLFAYSWILDLELVQNPAKPNNPNEKNAKFVRVTKGKIVAKDLFVNYVQPQIAAANNIALLAAPETSGDTE